MTNDEHWIKRQEIDAAYEAALKKIKDEYDAKLKVILEEYWIQRKRLEIERHGQ